MKEKIKGLLLCLVIAVPAWLLGRKFAVVGGPVISILLGMIVGMFIKNRAPFDAGIKFTSKKILKFAIILLGASLNITTVLTVGKFSLTVMLFTLATCFGLGYVIGKALGLDWKTSSLINAGTGICGGSAIAAIAPVIEATDMDIAYGMSATFLFDTIMVVVFPLLGRAMGLSDAAFGLWAGTAVNDTSSVVATGYAFSEAAGDFATMVKLTRTLAIIPITLVLAWMRTRSAQADGKKVELPGVQFDTWQDDKGETHMSLGFTVYGIKKTPVNVIKEAWNSVLYYGRIIFTSLMDLLRGRESINDLSGPVGIVTAIGQAASYGWQDLLELLVLITVNLGIFNLLPFPALDGGKVVFLVIEGVTGHAVPEKLQSVLTLATFGLLFGLMLFATYNDIIRLITGAV